MRAPADILGRDRCAEGGADRQRRFSSRGSVAGAAAEDQVMRAHDAFGAAGQHAGNFTDQLRGRSAQMARQQRHQGLGKITARKIVDAAIALGLADDGDDILGASGAVRNQLR